METADRAPGLGQPGNKGRPSIESRVLRVLNGIQRHEGLPVDATKMSNALMMYQDQVMGRIAETKGTKTILDALPLQTQEETAFIESIRHVRDAFDIVAYPFFDSTYQQVLSSEIYGNPLLGVYPDPTRQGDFILTPDEKSVLTKIIQAAGIQDDPNQLTYSYTSIPRWNVVWGSVEE